jgi:hypothetical protein
MAIGFDLHQIERNQHSPERLSKTDTIVAKLPQRSSLTFDPIDISLSSTKPEQVYV